MKLADRENTVEICRSMSNLLGEERRLHVKQDRVLRKRG